MDVKPAMTTKKRLYVGSDSGLTVLTGDGAAWLPFLRGLGRQVCPRHDRRARREFGIRLRYRGWAVRVARWLWVMAIGLARHVHSVAVDRSDSNIVYAGTEPVGLYRSKDGGQHWLELTALRNQPESVTEKWWFPQFPHESHVLSIFVDWHDPRVLCVGLEHGGILRSRDGGASWEDISAGIEYVDIHTVKGDPLQPNLYYTATARGFYRSERYGRDWLFAERGIDRSYFHDFGGDSGTSTGFVLNHRQWHATGLDAPRKKRSRRFFAVWIAASIGSNSPAACRRAWNG